MGFLKASISLLKMGQGGPKGGTHGSPWGGGNRRDLLGGLEADGDGNLGTWVGGGRVL